MSWQTVSLGELTDKIGSGSTPRGGSSSYKNSGVPFIRSMNVHDGSFKPDGIVFLDEMQAKALNNVILAKDDVLLNITGASVARVCRLPPRYVGGRVNQHVAIIRPQLDKLNSEYLAQCLIAPSIKQKLLRIAGAGATREAITKEHIQEFEIPLPPLDEQRRIAAILDQADDLRHKRRETLKRLSSLPSVLLEEICGELKKSGLLTISRLDALVRQGDRINYGVVQPGSETNEGVPLIRVENVVDDDFSVSKLKHISGQIEAQYSRSRLRGDEILIACVGSIGAVALTESAHKGYNIARAVARVPIDNQKADRVFLAEYIKSAEIQNYFKSETRTVAQPTLNIKQLCETPIALPPLDRQRAFAARVAEIDALKAHHRAHLARFDALFASLQHRAFRGEL